MNIVTYVEKDQLQKKKKKCLIIARHSEKSDNTKYMCSAYANFIF